jgi:DNA-binding protein YbaB
MVKQAGALGGQLKRIQKELESKTYESARHGVAVVVRGDMTVKSIRLDPACVDAAKIEGLQDSIARTVNDALLTAKKEAGKEMSRIAGGMGVGNFLR